MTQKAASSVRVFGWVMVYANALRMWIANQIFPKNNRTRPSSPHSTPHQAPHHVRPFRLFSTICRPVKELEMNAKVQRACPHLRKSRGLASPGHMYRKGKGN